MKNVPKLVIAAKNAISPTVSPLPSPRGEESPRTEAFLKHSPREMLKSSPGNFPRIPEWEKGLPPFVVSKETRIQNDSSHVIKDLYSKFKIEKNQSAAENNSQNSSVEDFSKLKTDETPDFGEKEGTVKAKRKRKAAKSQELSDTEEFGEKENAGKSKKKKSTEESSKEDGSGESSDGEHFGESSDGDRTWKWTWGGGRFKGGFGKNGPYGSYEGKVPEFGLNLTWGPGVMQTGLTLLTGGLTAAVTEDAIAEHHLEKEIERYGEKKASVNAELGDACQTRAEDLECRREQHDVKIQQLKEKSNSYHEAEMRSIRKFSNPGLLTTLRHEAVDVFTAAKNHVFGSPEESTTTGENTPTPPVIPSNEPTTASAISIEAKKKNPQ
jgi:hypothetical protein